MQQIIDLKTPAGRWEYIKAALRSRGSSLSDIARRMGLTKESVGKANRTPYPAVEAAIASMLEVTPSTLWPERYRVDGTPKRKRPNAPFTKPTLRKSSRVEVKPKALNRANGKTAVGAGK